jgi:hypothetical protein
VSLKLGEMGSMHECVSLVCTMKILRCPALAESVSARSMGRRILFMRRMREWV